MTTKNAPDGLHAVAGLARSAAWYGTAAALGKAASLLVVPYLTRQLGPNGYGLADLATSLAGLLIVAVRFGADIPTMRLSAASPNARSQLHTAYVIGTGLAGVLCAAALLPTSGFIAEALWSSSGDGHLAAAALLLVPVSALQFALINVLRFVERPRTFAVLAGIDLFAQMAGAVLFVTIGFGPFGVIAGYVIGSAIGMVAAFIAARPFLATEVSLPLTGRILKEGLPFVPGAAAFITADAISRMVAANVLGVSAVGHLALAIRIASVMSLSSVAFQMAWGPYGMGLSPGERSRKIFGRVATEVLMLISVAAVGLGSLAPEITAIVGGESFRPAAEVVPGLLLSAGLPAVLYLMATAAGISRLGRWVAVSSALGAVGQVAGMVILLPIAGAPGFSVGALIGRVAALVVLGRAVRGAAELPLKALVVLGGAAGTTLWLQALNADPLGSLGIRLAIAAVAAGVGVYLLRRWVWRFRLTGG